MIQRIVDVNFFRRGGLMGLGAILSSLCCAVESAQPKAASARFDAPAALNNALRQPMLAERITKSFTLVGQNEELVWISTKGAMLLQAHTKSTRNDLIITAGDVRTLTQRIAKLYLFRSWGIRSDVIANDLKKADADYRADMAKLLAAPHNTEQIRSELALAETQYLFLKQAIERLNDNKTSITELEHVTKACDNILEVMERVTRLYAAVKA